MTARDLLLSKRLPGNTLDQQAAVQRALNELANREVEVPQLSGIATDFGLINAGTIVMGNGQPLGAGFTGTTRFADPLEWPAGSGNYWTEIGFQDDIMMVGISAEDGSVYAAGGLLALYNKGIALTGPVGLVNFQAVNAFKVYSGGLGFGLVNGSSRPTPYLSLTDDSSITGSNLVANGDFETGTLSNWTVSATAPGGANVFEGLSIFSKYALSLSKPSNPAAVTVTSDRITSDVTGNKGYIVSFIAVKNATQGDVQVKWYDNTSGGTLLRTDTLDISLLVPGSGISQYGWGQHVAHLVSPTGTQSFEIVCRAPAGGTAPFGSVYIDNVTVRASSVLDMIVLRELGPYYSSDGIEIPLAPAEVGHAVWQDSNANVILSKTIKANNLGPKGWAPFHLDAEVTNVSGSTKTVTWTVTFGGTTFHTLGPTNVANGTTMGFRFDGLLVNEGGTSLNFVVLHYSATSSYTATMQTETIQTKRVTGTVDTTADRDLVITGQLSAALASLALERTGGYILGPYHHH